MTVKYINQDGIKRITAVAAVLSATGAWYILNRHNEMGLNDLY